MGKPRLALVGLFVVGGLLLFAVGLFMIGDRRLLFTESFEVAAGFGDVTGVEVGTGVRLAGLDAGEVLAIELPPGPGGRFVVRMRVRENLRRLVRTNSAAAILTDGLLGAAFIQIRAGSDDAPPVADGGTIDGVDAIAIADLIAEGRETFRTVADEFIGLRGQMGEALGDLGGTLGELSSTVARTTTFIDDVSTDVRRITQASVSVMNNADAMLIDSRELVSGVRAGRGTVGRLLTDDELYTQLTGVVRETEATVRSVRTSAEHVEGLVARFAGPDGPGAGLLDDAGDAVSLARDAMADMAENTEALKRNWLFRGFFSDRGFYNLDELTLDEYRQLLQDDRYTPLRVWLAADRLFETGSDGSVVLRDGADRRLDEAMGELLGHARNRPLVIEGYATDGGAGRAYVTSQARAEVVEAYVSRVFRWSAALTGTMPIGIDAPGSPSGDGRWDGVALTLFAETERLERAAGRTDP